MKLIHTISAAALLSLSVSATAFAANHNDRHLSGDIDSTYGTLDTRRNDWRETRRENCCDLFDRKSEHRYGTSDDRKKHWRKYYRDSHSGGKICPHHSHESTHSH